MNENEILRIDLQQSGQKCESNNYRVSMWYLEWYNERVGRLKR